MNRREALAVAGGVGLGLVASRGDAAAQNQAQRSVEDVLQSLKIDAGQMHPNLSVAPAARPTVDEIIKVFGADGRAMHQAEAKVEEVKDARDQPIATVLSYTCVSNLINNLGFQARCVSYRVRNIEWKAGDGWPIYHEYCPVNNFSLTMRFPHAKVHQVVPIFGGSYWIGCSPSSSDCGNQVTPVYFAVNDDKYDDNRGTFVVEIISWSA